MDQTKVRDFEAIFYPVSIAVVGVSRNGTKPGNGYLTNLINGGFEGQLYAVGSGGGSFEGKTIFPSLRDIPDTVEFVIVSSPKHRITDLLDDCHSKGVRVAQLFSAGFSETTRTEDVALENQIVQKARALGIRIIGPNCIGIGNPAHRMRLMWRPLPHDDEAGTVAILSQSGGNAGLLAEMGLVRGVRFSKLISFGNGTDIDSLDYLEYLGNDPETTIIGAYLEGVRNGRGLLHMLGEIARNKPVAVLKGGLTDAGAQTVISHTASLGGSEKVWQAALRQSGAIQANTIEELADVLSTLYHLPEFAGKRVAIISGITGAGGGACVAASDAFAREGLETPRLHAQTITRLKQTLPAAGSIFQNPVDVGAVATYDLDAFATAVTLVFADPNIDMLVIHLQASFVCSALGQDRFDQFCKILIDTKRSQLKPMLVLSQSPSAESEEKAFEQRCITAGIPCYASFDGMAKALAKATGYWNDRYEASKGRL